MHRAGSGSHRGEKRGCTWRAEGARAPSSKKSEPVFVEKLLKLEEEGGQWDGTGLRDEPGLRDDPGLEEPELEAGGSKRSKSADGNQGAAVPECECKETPLESDSCFSPSPIAEAEAGCDYILAEKTATFPLLAAPGLAALSL